MNKNQRLYVILVIALTLGFGFTISTVSAAPPIAVTSADPSNAEQGTTDLTVLINGRGFDNNMDVKFCRSETNDGCVDGGVDVQPGSVEFISSKQLKVTVDVTLEAIIGNFDIEAISLSSRRRGRGIENFAVLKAGSGNTETTFLVEVITASETLNGVDTTSMNFGGCAGTSTPSNQLSVKFLVDPRGDCGPVTIQDPEGYRFLVYLLEIAVQEKKNGDTVRFFFTEMATPQYAGQEFVWHSDSLPVLISSTDDGLEITGINGSWTGFHLTKTHQPDKRFVSTEVTGITVGKIVYTPE